MKIAVGSDHAGFVAEAGDGASLLREDGHEVVDVGTDSTAPVDYPDFAEAVGQAVTGGRAERGVLICGSGVGASVAANKIPGIRAAICHDIVLGPPGRRARRHERAGAGRPHRGARARPELVRAFVGASYTGEERHVAPPRQGQGAGGALHAG